MHEQKFFVCLCMYECVCVCVRMCMCVIKMWFVTLQQLIIMIALKGEIQDFYNLLTATNWLLLANCHLHVCSNGKGANMCK